MDTIDPAPVVVAVGPDGSAAAVRFAAAEALRRGRGLHLVHATGPAAADLQTNRRRREDAERVLAHVEDDARYEVGSCVPVTSAIVPGAPVEAVARAAAGSPLVVVGRRTVRARTHPQLRSAADAIAAHLRVPVASVPEEWRSRALQPLVVVGVDPARIAVDAVLEGFAAARQRRARLVLLAAWWRPVGADRRSGLGHVDESIGADLLAGDVALATSALRAWYGDVVCEVVVEHRPAAAALVDAADDADLLILGRHEPWLPAGSCVGPVATAVAHGATCPVLLTAVDDQHRHAGAQGA